MDPAELLASLGAPAGLDLSALPKAVDRPGGTDFGRWQADFRLAARTDGYAALAACLQRTDLRLRPHELVQGTIDVVAACVALAQLDGLPSTSFMHWQGYPPSTASGAVYSVVFDIHQRGAARLVTGPRLEGIPFAGLYGMPWPRHGLLGYERFWIERIDRAHIGQDERDRIERRVSADLRFDYAEDEVDFHVDARSVDGALVVYVRDHRRG